MYRNFLSCFYHPVCYYLCYFSGFTSFFCMSLLLISFVLFFSCVYVVRSTFLFPCVRFLFLFGFVCHSVNPPFLSALFPHLITKYI